MSRPLPPKGTEVLSPSGLREANAAEALRRERAREVERDRLERAVQDLPVSMRARLTEMAVEQIRAGLPPELARAVTAESVSVRALVRVLYKRQERIEMEARTS